LQGVLSGVADGIAWRALNYNRPAIAILGTGNHVNRLSAEEGLLAEVHEVEAYWERGIFAIHNDLTSCLRHGDVTAITPGGHEIAEVKASPGGDAKRQMTRLREATDLINLGRRTDSAGVTAHIVPVGRPYRSRLRHVGRMLRDVREHGYAAKRLSACQFVAASHVGALQQAVKRRQRDREKLGWQNVSGALIFEHTTFTRRMRDRRDTAPVLAPLSIYPFDVDDVADLMLGYMEFTTDLNVAVIRDRLVAGGVSAEVVLGDDAESRFLIARRVVGNRQLEVHVEAALRDQLLLELMYPEDAVAVVRAVLAAVETEREPERVDRIPAMTDEARVWEACPQ
jgi:hypothetical protein